MRTVRARISAIAVAGLIGISATACMADPPPPVRETLPTHTPNEYPDERTVTVATDTIGAGFNPHLGADQGTVTTAIAAMTLPSTFIPVKTPDGLAWQMNEALLTSAEVTSYEPFSVEYKIVNDAQWSDGLPVTGDDFHYLWEQMSRQPNVIGPAGYRAISDVQTSGGGKVVTVTFAEAYPDWRQLFNYLLPSHTLRSDPTGFQTGMDKGKPVTAGPFQIYSIDRARDEVRLIRNDRYWRKPPEIDQVVLRRAGTPQQMAQTIRNGDSTLAALPAGAASAAELGAIPGVVGSRLPTSRALAVNVNSRSETMRSRAVREAILGMLDGRLITAAAAGDTVVTPFANTVYPPSDPGYQPVDRVRPADAEILALLAGAGYRPGAPIERPAPVDTSASPTSAPAEPTTAAPADIPGLPYGIAPIQSDGQDLAVRIGATNTDQRTMSAAETMADQLRSRGVRASVVGMSNTELYGQALTSGRVDLVVGWTGVGGSPAVEFASQVACQAPPKGTEAGAHTVEPQTDATPNSTVLPTTPTSAGGTTTSKKPEQNVPADDSYTGNISGLCDPELMALADTAMSSEDPSGALAQAEPLLAAQAVYLPIFQDTMFSAVTDRLIGVAVDGPLQVGVFGGADRWTLR